MKVGVISAGAWGTALAVVCARSKHDVTIWEYDEAAAKTIQKSRKNANLPGIILPKNITVTADFRGLSRADIWVIATPNAYFRETIRKSRLFYKKQPIVICTKSVEASTGKFMTQILAEELGVPETVGLFGAMAGPTFAGEAASGVPTGATIAGTAKLRKAASRAFAALELDETDDVLGVELCGAGKNAIAIMTGYLDGIGAGENERALILTRAYGDIVRLGKKLGAKLETFLSLCGLGDLFLTAGSRTSRNYSAGWNMAKSKAVAGTVEGVAAARGLYRLARKHGVKSQILADLDKMLA